MLNYSYNDVIFGDLSGRIDGSSQFGSNKRFAPFFSTGAGVNIHNLKFFKENTPWLTQFKLRGTYGMTGKVSFPSYAAQNKYEMFTDWQYPTGDGVQIMYLGNPNLKWERTLQTDVGFEFEILNGCSTPNTTTTSRTPTTTSPTCSSRPRRASPPTRRTSAAWRTADTKSSSRAASSTPGTRSST